MSGFLQKIRLILTLAMAAALFLVSPKGSAKLTTGFSSQKSGFSIKAKDIVCPYRVNGLFVMPGEKVSFELADGSRSRTYSFSSEAKNWTEQTPLRWQWEAPHKPGLYPVRVTQSETNDSILFNVFVMVPANKAKNGYLNGYKIGEYPAPKKKNAVIYEAPKGFIEITKQNKNTLVAPHFKLSQFLCKQEGSYPKYIVLREGLLHKLESVLEKINEHGYRSESLSIMSGYRTPYYNRAIRNVSYSRHLWGDAADIFIDDQPRDNYMDDLNNDGKRDAKDIAILTSLIEDTKTMPGGLGVYKSTRHHGPFVHIDARGDNVRW